MRKLVLVIFLVCLSAISALAATPGEPAFKKARLVANYPADRGLTLDFSTNEAECRKHYGKKWLSRCATPLGRPGNTAAGLKLSPPVKGRWVWRDSSSVDFIPENAATIKPATKYELDLSGMDFPSFIHLDKRHVAVTTLPPAAQLLSSQFWIDPSPQARHRYAVSIAFNYPQNKDIFNPELIKPRDALFEKAEKVWSDDGLRLAISWASKKLPEAPSRAGVYLEGMGQISEKDGMFRYWPPDKNGGTSFYQNVPGKNELFTIKNAEIIPNVGENLDRGHALKVETSLYARDEDLLKNLSVWELPQYTTAESTVAFDWAASPSIPADVLKKSRKLDIAPLDNGNAPRASFCFSVPAAGGRYVLVTVNGDLVSASGQKLGRNRTFVLKAESGAPALGLMQPGNILPLKENGILDIYSTDLDGILWEAQLVRDPFLALVAGDSPDVFANPLADRGPDMERISLRSQGEIKLVQKGAGKAQFSTLPLGAVLNDLTRKNKDAATSSGLARIRLTGFRDGEQKAWASRLVLATNLGIQVKKSAMGSLDCFVQSLINGKPAQGAKVSILGANGRPVAEGHTDSRGHASFPSLAGLDRESLPVAAIAWKDHNLAWLPLRDRSRELNYSEFPTRGGRPHGNGINALVFSQRGIYRPGDTLRFGCMTRKSDFSLLPENTPLYAEILDPRGLKAWGGPLKAGKNGLSEINWSSLPTSPSGRYLLNVMTAKDGEVLGSVAVRIEEFQPDTLKLKISAPKVKGWVHIAPDKGGKLPVRLDLQNLYGSPAAGHKVAARIESGPAIFNFPGYEGFVFRDSTPFPGQGVVRELPPERTDAAGSALVELPNELIGKTSATITVCAEGFELGGGRATAGRASFIASPMESILGYRPVGSITNLNYIERGKKGELDFIALNADLAPVSMENLRFSISRRRYATSLASDGTGGFRYDETPVSEPIREWRESIGKKGRKVSLDTDSPGEFILIVRDSSNRVLAEVPYAVVGERLEAPDSTLAGGKMRLRLDKNHYAAGDTINISLSVPYTGSGLITLERDGVEAFEWFKAGAGDSAHAIKVPDNFEGKGYVVVSFIRSGESPAVYMSPHTYAVAPFEANIRQRDMGIALDVPEKTSPGERMKIRLSSRDRGSAILFAVDEGILQLTNYQMPKPLMALLSDRALSVRTMQAYDLLMPDHGRMSTRISAFGGGMEGAPFGMRFLNPFKRKNEPPVATWRPIADLGPEGMTVELPIPQYYNGKLRIMVVGASPEKAGSAMKTAFVRAPIVLSPQMPVSVAPGDLFEGALTVANTTPGKAVIKLGMKADPELEIMENIPEQVEIAADSELVLPFKVRAGSEPGALGAHFTAQTGSDEYKRSCYLSARPASPLRTSLLAGRTSSNLNIGICREVYAKNAASVASISTLPIPLARNFSAYLDTYPHGCTEQLVSRSFAHVLLRAWPWIIGDDKKVRTLLNATLAAIRERFNGNGVSLWPNGEEDLLLTAYCADFLLALGEAGIGGGADLLDNICEALANSTALNAPTVESARASAYAIWVLTRQGRITTQLIENLLDSLRQRNVKGWQSDITAALLAASQKELRVEPISMEKMIFSPEGMFDEYGQYALFTTLMAKYFPEKQTEERNADFFETSGFVMKENTYATFSASQGIRALMNISARRTPEILQAKISCADNNKEKSKYELLAAGALLNFVIGQCRKYELKIPEGNGPVFWQVATTGYDITAPALHAAHGIEVKKTYLDMNGNELEEFRQGQEVKIQITARAMKDKIRNCVLTDLLPGGFEMVIPTGDVDGMPEAIKFVDRREDRMLVFTDLSSQPLVFTYRARPVAAGTFTIPPVTAEAMYDNALYGQGEGGKRMKVLN